MRFKMRWALALLPAIALAMPAFAQVRDVNLADTDEPGSVIIFPKFVNRAAVTTAGDLAVLPRTEIEIGVVCPKGATCTEHQLVKIRFHWVCPGSDDIFFKFVCQETDFDIFVTVDGKLAFSADGTPINGNSPRAPAPQCPNGFLIGWVINTSDQPIKFDGLIGDAVLRGPALGSGPNTGTSTAVEAYKALAIQADPALASGALLTITPPGELPFDGGPGHYLGLPRTLFGDVKFDKETAGAPAPNGALNQTWLILMTLDVDSNFPNLPTFVNLDFFNESLNTVSATNPNFEAITSTSTHFVCWTQQQLTSIDSNLTQAFQGTRKGVVIVKDAQKVGFIGITTDEPGPVTLIGLVQTFEGTAANSFQERSYIFNMFNNSDFVATEFETVNDEQ
jgi:hypothetical protein